MTYMAPSEERYCVQLQFALPVGRPRTHRVASLRAGPVGRISYNLYFDCKLVRYVTCDLINEYTYVTPHHADSRITSMFKLGGWQAINT